MRNIVNRADGRRIHVARMLGQLFVCADGCCCGRVQDGYPPVPRDLYHREWERRELRNRVHLTIGGCLGPCALANVVMLLFDGRQAWFHSISSDEQVLALYDWIEVMVDAQTWSPPPAALAAYHFTASTWEDRPDGSTAIHQQIIVERDSQKRIVIGKGGRRLKAIGAAAREEIAHHLGRPVHLFLHVKVEPKWGEDRSIYREIGLEWAE